MSNGTTTERPSGSDVVCGAGLNSEGAGVSLFPSVDLQPAPVNTVWQTVSQNVIEYIRIGLT
jgi:hypothetical protein